jgi:O-antigen/teichoic acid export membrane protein
MTVKWSKAVSVPRRLLHGGRAGDAHNARGRDIASNVALQLAGRAVTMALSVVTVALVARTLDPDGFGVWTASLAFVGLFATVADLGLTYAATQRMAAHPAQEHEWLGALAGLRLMCFVTTALICAACVPLFLGHGHGRQVVALILVTNVLGAGVQGLLAVFQSRLRAGIGLAFSVLQGVLWLTAVVVLASTDASVVAFAAVYAGIVAFIAVLQLATTRRLAHIAWRSGRARWRPLMRAALPLGVANALIIVYYQVDAVMLLRMAGPHEAGIYGAAYRFLDPLITLPAILMASLFPVLSAAMVTDRDRARRLVQEGADWMAIVSLPVLAVAVTLSPQIVGVVYGSGFARSAGVVPILMIALVSISFGSLAGFLAPLLGLQWRLALYSAIGVVANVGLNLVLIPRYGAYGSAWATVSTEVLTMGFMLTTVLYALGLRLALGRMLRTVVVAGLAAAAMEVTQRAGLLPALAVGGAVYVAALGLLRVVSVADLRAVRGTRGASA